MNQKLAVVVAAVALLWIGMVFWNCSSTQRYVEPGKYTVSATVIYSTESTVEEAFDLWVEKRMELRRISPFVNHNLYMVIQIGNEPERAVMWDSFAYPSEIKEQLISKGWIN